MTAPDPNSGISPGLAAQERPPATGIAARGAHRLPSGTISTFITSNSEGDLFSGPVLSISTKQEREEGEEGSTQPPGQPSPLQTVLIKALVLRKKPSLIDFWFTERRHTATSHSAC